LARKTKFKIDLNLDSVKVKRVAIDSNGDYHIYVSCTEVDGFVKTISPSFLDALPREEWLPEG
jgi:hypothetical protein